MSTILVAAILGALVISICLLLFLFDKKHQRKKMNRLLAEFSKRGSFYKLGFSSQFLMNTSVIGLDGIQRKLLVVTTDDWRVFNHVLIDLKEVKTCSVKKVYSIDTGGAAKKKAFDQHLEIIGLCCEFYTQKLPVEILFFNQLHDPYCEIPALKQKANEWKLIISQMLNSPIKERA